MPHGSGGKVKSQSRKGKPRLSKYLILIRKAGLIFYFLLFALYFYYGFNLLFF